MTALQILTAFELEIGKIDDLNKPLTDDSMYWLNQAIITYVKTKYAGTSGTPGDRYHAGTYGALGFEQTEKRTQDLHNLVETYKVIKPKSTDFGTGILKYNIQYPKNLMYEVNEVVKIADTEGDHEYITSVFECTHDSLMYRITNSLTDFHYIRHKARPLGITVDDGRELYTDGNYIISEYTMSYIREPKKLTLEHPQTEYSEFDVDTMYEVIKLAATMYLENTKNERYATLSQEVLRQE